MAVMYEVTTHLQKRVRSQACPLIGCHFAVLPLVGTLLLVVSLLHAWNEQMSSLLPNAEVAEHVVGRIGA